MTGKGRPVVIERFNPFRINITQVINEVLGAILLNS